VVELPCDREDRLWDKVTHAMYLGSEQRTKRMRKLVESRPRSTDHPTPQHAAGPPDLRAIVRTVAAIGSTSQEAARCGQFEGVRSDASSPGSARMNAADVG
jgi:hypothetical protein